jgi:hypothetical protein
MRRCKGEMERTEILDGRVHLGHSNDIGDSTFGRNQTNRQETDLQQQKMGSPSKSIRVLFSELFKDDNTEFAQELILSIRLDNRGQTGREVGSQHTDLCALVGESPKDHRDDLR